MRFRHSDDALEAIGLRQAHEMESGEIWFPGELDGFALALVAEGIYHLRKCYRGGGRSRPLCCGTFAECQKWLAIYLGFQGSQSRQNMIAAGMARCRLNH